jgi:hypothetical protein
VFQRKIGRQAKRSLDKLFLKRNIPSVEWEVEYTDAFEDLWDTLSEDEQESVDAVVGLLVRLGPRLSFPHSSKVRGSRHGHMRELRIQHHEEPYRVLYAFDPRRAAILLLGGVNTGDDRWYVQFVPRAEELYDDHVETLRREGLING